MSAQPGARIYYLHPLLAGPARQWDAHLDRCAALGFDHLLIAPPFDPGCALDVFVTSDHERIHPALAWSGDAQQFLAQLAKQCRARGLALMLDLSPDRIAADAALLRSHPQWFCAASRALDPRLWPADRDVLSVRLDSTERVEQLASWWSQRVQDFAAAGVVGFRCLGLHSTGAAFWKQVISSARGEHRDARFLAWNAGLSWTQSAVLAVCGFDAFASSACWWNYRDGWLADESERLARLGALLTFAESPFDMRLAASVAAPLRECAARRALRFTGAIADHWMLTMGCEFGALAPLDPRRGTPEDFVELSRHPLCDHSKEIQAINASIARAGTYAGDALRSLSAPGATVAAFLRGNPRPSGIAETGDTSSVTPAQAGLQSPSPNGCGNTERQLDSRLRGNDDFGSNVSHSFTKASTGAQARLILVNSDLGANHAVSIEHAAQLGAQPLTALAPGETRVLDAHAAAPIRIAAITRSRRALAAAVRAPRIAIERLAPALDDGRFAIRRVCGETITVSADVFIDGHERIAAALLWRAIDQREWQEAPMRALGNDRWTGEVPLLRVGRHEFTVIAWFDAWASFQHALIAKHAAGVDTALELEEGRLLLAQIAEQGDGDTGPVAKLVAILDKAGADTRLHLLLAPETAALAAAARHRPHLLRHEPAQPVEAERIAARYASWYELFPRSQTDDPARHGRFKDVIARLPAIRDMGFDVLYFPPIHPIGTTHRKGRNNTLTPTTDDPGSPYAIGSADGGHEAIDPQLGTLEDFRCLRDAAAAQGLELALDFAIQCSPDHPWLNAHPGWFSWRPDGSMRYAENPPKKYQDIVNVDFYADDAVPALWLALRDVVLGWLAQGVKIFRVDNPHTKPLPFWEWLISDVRGRDPEVIFLAEAFTRPAMMNRLGKLGFSQSYTYFTWRNTKQELSEYFTQLNTAPLSDYYRPHFFVNTPDINPYFLQGSGRAGFLIRAALAAMGSGLWGMYSGFELCESAALPGKEEYLDSEKFEIRVRDFEAPGNIVAEITQLNRIRRLNPALQTHLGLRLYNAFNDRILYFGKATPDRRNFILVAVSLDPHQAQEAQFELPLWEFGLPDDASLHGEDLMNGHRWTWQGKTQFMRIEPSVLPFGIWRVTR